MTSVSAQYLVNPSLSIPYCHTLPFRVKISSKGSSKNMMNPMLNQMSQKEDKNIWGIRIVVSKGEDCVEPWSDRNLKWLSKSQTKVSQRWPWICSILFHSVRSFCYLLSHKVQNIISLNYLWWGSFVDKSLEVVYLRPHMNFVLLLKQRILDQSMVEKRLTKQWTANEIRKCWHFTWEIIPEKCDL